MYDFHEDMTETFTMHCVSAGPAVHSETEYGAWKYNKEEIGCECLFETCSSCSTFPEDLVH